MSGWQKTASGAGLFMPFWVFTTVIMAVSELVAKLNSTQSQATIKKHIPFMTLNIIFLSSVLMAGLTVVFPSIWPNYPDNMNLLLSTVSGPLALTFLLLTHARALEYGRRRLRTWGRQRGLTWGPFAEEHTMVVEIQIVSNLVTQF